MNAGWWTMGGIGIGAGLMYLADPRSGRRRRARVQDKAVHAAHEAENAAGVLVRDMSHRTRGFFFERLSLLRHEDVDDKTLEERVRSRLGRVCSHPGAIRVSTREGCVTLEGPILKAEHHHVVSRIHRVRGVREVEDKLEIHKQAGHHPDLQGGVGRRGDRPELLQQNWAPTWRFMMGVGGLGLVSYSLSSRGPLGWLVGVSGLLLSLRSFTNLDLKRLTGVGAGRRAIVIHKDITVNAPVEEVFAFWRAFENFPRFMSHIEEVRVSSEERSHWRVRGPVGVNVEWDAVITRLVPNQVLAWKSVEGAMVGNAGVIHFEPEDGGRATRLDIQLSYNPPAGAMGHAFAKLLGADPKKQMDDDLLRFKSLIEAGKATAHGHTVTREEVAPSPESGPRMH